MKLVIACTYVPSHVSAGTVAYMSLYFHSRYLMNFCWMTVKKLVNSDVFKFILFYNSMSYINNIMLYILFCYYNI